MGSIGVFIRKVFLRVAETVREAEFANFRKCVMGDSQACELRIFAKTPRGVNPRIARIS